MKVKNIGTNPVHGIKPGEVGELPKNRESRLKQYVKYGMLELVEPKKEEPKKEESNDLTRESSKSDFGKSKVDDLKAFCEKEKIEISEDANKKQIIKAIFLEVFKGE